MRKKVEEVPGDYVSSERQLEEFIQGVVWREIEAELREWLAQITEDLIEGAEHDEMLRHQGRGQAIKKVLLLPHVMLEAAKIAAESK